MSDGFNREMQLYAYDGPSSYRVKGGRLVYTFSTLANERQLADDLAATHGLRQGEGHVAIFEPGTEGSINKLELMP